MKFEIIKSVILNGTKWNQRISIGCLFLLAACTDYVQKIEDERDAWREEQAKLALIEEESSSSISAKASSSSEEKNYSSSSLIFSSSSESKKNSSSSNSTIQSSSSYDSKTSSSSTLTTPSSSSIFVVSSSSSLSTSSSGKESWEKLNSAISYGETTDERDGQIYKTVVIGEQTWMAENLNFEVENSYCYNDSTSNCSKYGRLYSWATAVGKTESSCGQGNLCSLPSGTVQGICPEKWHLPSKAEFESLILKAGGQNSGGNILKSKTDWNFDGNGIDVYGFTALPAGNRYANGNNYGKGGNASFWSSTENNLKESFYMNMGFINDSVSMKKNYKERRLSVRCIKDAPNSIVESSSSKSAESSSNSTTTAEPCKTTTEDNCEYGTLEDSRDGHIYKTVKIGNQWWMAENLIFETEKSICREDKSSYCSKYGRYYLWSEAMDSIGVYSANGTGCGFKVNCTPNHPVQGICPSGWHLPDTSDISALYLAVGGKNTAGQKLKSLTDWTPTQTVCSNGNGSDSYGFSLYPVGYQNNLGQFASTTNGAYFWMSTFKDSEHAYHTSFGSCVQNGSTPSSPETKNYKMTIRCIKN